MVTPAAIAVGGALAAGGILRATQTEALLAGPDYIRDGQPEGLTRRVGIGLARAACQAYGNNPGSVNADKAVFFENACRPYLDTFEDGNGAAINQPFTGGQCATAYTIRSGPYTTNYYSCSTGALVSSGAGVERGRASSLGPFNWIRPVVVNAGTCGSGQIVLQAQRADGFIYQVGTLALAPSGQRAEIVGLQPTVTRDDGLPDDCGNPPPEVSPPTAPTTPFPIPVPIVFAPDVNIETNVEINPDGTINFDIGTGPITIDPFSDNADGSDTGGGGADDSPPSPEPGPELPGGNGGFGGDDSFGPPPVGRRWVGACITITNKPTNQPPIPGSEPEDVYAAVVGNIRLVYQASGTRQTDTPVRIQAKKVCVWEAVRKLNPTGVSVDLQPGFGYTYRPFSVPLDA